ncbi:MAG: hypothetical protein H8D26_08085 [Methanomicrobia archaeon]|nr:hypothetical protein [Methanomicrobia archaeon]
MYRKKYRYRGEEWVYQTYVHGCGDAINILRTGRFFKRSAWDVLMSAEKELQVMPGILITASRRGEETAKWLDGTWIDIGIGGNYQSLKRGAVSFAGREEEIVKEFDSILEDKKAFLHTVIASSGGTGSALISNSAGFLPAEKGYRELVFLIRNGNPTYRQRENLLLTKRAVYEKLEALPELLTVVEFINKGNLFPYKQDDWIVGKVFSELQKIICYEGGAEPKKRFEDLSARMWYVTSGTYPLTARLANTYELAVEEAFSNARGRIWKKGGSTGNVREAVVLISVPMFDDYLSETVERRVSSITGTKNVKILERIERGLKYVTATILLNFAESESPDAAEILKIKEGEPNESHEYSKMEDFEELVVKADLKGHLSDYSKDLKLKGVGVRGK